MRRKLLLTVLGVAIALGAWVWSTDEPPTAADPASASVPAPPARSAVPVPPRDDGARRGEEVAQLLARPLFNPSRRPPDEAIAPVAAAPTATLPRMTAILIDGARRTAIFDGGGRPVALGEGGRIGPFTVQSIEPQQVTIVGPGGRRIVRTSFSNAAPPAPSALPRILPPALPPLAPQSPPAPLLPGIGNPNLPPGRSQ